MITKNTASDPFLPMDSRETKEQTRAMVERVSFRAHVSILTRLFTVKQRSHSKAYFKHRTSHVPNQMLISKNNSFCSFALGSVHVKFDV